MHVLLVEDNGPIARNIQTALRTENIVVDTTESRKDALEIAKLYDYDIILLDLSLPDMDTASAAASATGAGDDARAVLSTQSRPENKVQCLGPARRLLNQAV